VKHFCNVRSAIPYIQDIEIINAFRDGVSNIKIVEEIAMKKSKTVVDLLTVANTCIEASRPGLDSSSPVARGPQIRSRTIRRSTRPIGETARTVEIVGFAASSPLIRKRRCIFVALTTQRSGARSIVPQDIV
jgi:hypothetical protein